MSYVDADVDVEERYVYDRMLLLCIEEIPIAIRCGSTTSSLWEDPDSATVLLFLLSLFKGYHEFRRLATRELNQVFELHVLREAAFGMEKKCNEGKL